MKDRILNIMRQEKMNQQEFAKALGISPASLSSIFNGRTSPTIKHAEALHKYFPGLRLNWLLFGEGEMYDTNTAEESENEDGSALGAGVSGMGTSAPVEGTLFDPSMLDSFAKNQNTAGTMNFLPEPQVVKEIVKYTDKPPRQIVEIRIFFDDGTFETFSR